MSLGNFLWEPGTVSLSSLVTKTGSREPTVPPGRRVPTSFLALQGRDQRSPGTRCQERRPGPGLDTQVPVPPYDWGLKGLSSKELSNHRVGTCCQTWGLQHQPPALGLIKSGDFFEGNLVYTFG